MYEKKIRFIDLFAGVGGFRLGLQRAGKEIFECVYTNEWDKYACQTYNKNFGTKIEPTDITKVRVEDVPKHDLLCGGFPCQSFSIAGKRGGFEDTRGTMFFEICRILEHHRPRLVFLENVKGLANHDKGKTFRTILRSFDKLGYDAEWQVLNSKNFGVPQNRERIFIIGHLRGEPIRETFPLGEGVEAGNLPTKKLREQISNTLRTNYSSGFSNETYVQEGGEQVMAWSSSGREWGREQGVKEGEFNTLSTGEGGGSQSTKNFIVGERIRRLTPIECERLQGFPDNWTEGVSDTQRYKQMGNAVTVNVIEAIGRRILDAGL